MTITVQGVKIDLTKEQIEKVNKHHAELEKSCSSFVSVLKKFGFKKMNTKGWANPDQICYQSPKWFAEIHKHRVYSECHVYGEGIEPNSYWGGAIVGCPKELMELLIKATDEFKTS